MLKQSKFVVPPLRLSQTSYPIIAVTQGEAQIERTGERLPFDPELFFKEQWYPSIWISDGSDHLFYLLNEHYKKDKHWTWRIQESSPPCGDFGPTNTTILYFGFRRKSHSRGPGSHSRRSRIHYPFDASSFCDSDTEDHLPGTDRLDKLFRLGISLRNFMDEMGLRPRFNPAGLAAQLLRHPKFYPEQRARVPVWINEKARPHLPGNHYDLFVEAGENVADSVYVDQKSAHHFAARTVPLPSSDSIEGRGFTRGNRTWLRSYDKRYHSELKRYGLFQATVRVPHVKFVDVPFLPSNLRKPGIQCAHIWSSEIGYLQEMNIDILSLHWSLTSSEQDHGLAKYAEWAEVYGQEHPELKHTLLSAYGMLAVKERDSAAVVPDKWAKKRGTFLGPHFIAGKALDPITFHGGPCVNVLQRGLIEAFTRRLSLSLAHSMRRDALLGIYGDAVLAKHLPGQQLEAPWRAKGVLHNLTFETATRFTSDELCRLPGTPRMLRHLVQVA